MSSMAGRASEVRAFSQDAIREREKINTEALKDYAGLDSRYYDMIQDLPFKVDTPDLVDTLKTNLYWFDMD